ncbi:purple acid phosphatase-like isoform X1 [Telopea speciosissima]|uniref:purple acid phosphatase-like isoform X1 n=1 Tax=Telopea speciosissima TaxID=54955 RepID=UPI001CC4BF37|nr:purple acid phosphatase-like isoform X1 [Telopea speciosissima]
MEKMGKLEFSSFSTCVAVLVLGLILNSAVLCNGGATSSYVRAVAPSIDMPYNSPAFYVPPGYNAPEQVHITQGDYLGQGVIVSWITPVEPGTSTVLYWAANTTKVYTAEGYYFTYSYYNYTSGFIHHTTLLNLDYNTKYYYEVGVGNTTRQFYFTTPPPVGPDVPYTFGLIGDLGQTYDSNMTLDHYINDPLKGETVLYLGDLCYADDWPYHDNVKWDTWGRLVEKSAAYQPWIWTAGNHEIDFAPQLGEPVPFKPFSSRYHTPYNASGSTAPFWYSIKRASAHIIVLASYSSYGRSTPQYTWLTTELANVNRTETPWLIIIVHAPWYNSDVTHYMEGETMRVQFEAMAIQYKVDAIFAGHVHAYERSYRISNIAYNITNGLCTPVPNQFAPIYVTVGDGGNIEGLAGVFTQPQPSYSAFREAAFGHAMFSIKNRTHAYFSWNRNQDGYAVESDSLWFYNRYYYPMNETMTMF